MNGQNEVTVRTLHGKFSFLNQRYLSRDRNSGSDFLSDRKSDLIEQGYNSTGLSEWICYFANRLSYRENEKLLKRISGCPLYSMVQIQNMTVEPSKRGGQFFNEKNVGADVRFDSIDHNLNLYGAQSKEVCYFDDGVGVKRQKAKRQDYMYVKEKETIQTDVIMIQKPAGESFEYLSRTNDADSVPDLESRVGMTLSRMYKGVLLLPLVAIVDGAQSVRCRVGRMFGEEVKIILDWYHLKKRVREEMSGMGLKKEEKEILIKNILEELWVGHTPDALIYIDRMVLPQKNEQLKEELLNYLQKHESEIVNYGRRQMAGKCIGSGRGEKGNDQVTACRQKKKGSAWSPEGSNALSTFKCIELNGDWEKFWHKTA